MAVKDPDFGTRRGLMALRDWHIPIKDAGWDKRAMYFMKGGYIRNLGVAIIAQVSKGKKIVVYGHTQVTNGDPTAIPPGMILDKQAAEQLFVMLAQALEAYDK